MSAEAFIGLLGAITALITILTTLSKLQTLLTTLQARDHELRSQLENQSDRLELVCNGLRERIEHCNARLTAQFKDCSDRITDIENYLQKNTSYEKRGRL